MAAIQLKQVGIRLGSGDKGFSISDLDLEIAAGEFVVLVGPSGSGKSTVLRAIAGLEAIAEGEIWIDQQRVDQVPPMKRGLAMVFQNYALYPHMTVAQNMGFALKLAGNNKAEIAERVQATAELLKIKHLLERRPKELSGGQRQRVAIGRAIVRKPKAFLFDEPLSNLDAGLRSHMRIELLNLHRQLGATMIYVTHDQVEAMTLADRIVFFSSQRLEQIGSPHELFNRPKNRSVAEFIGQPKMNMLPARLTDAGLTLSSGQTLGRVRLSEPVAEIIIGIRPRHIGLGGRADLSGEVVLVERLGDEHLLHIQTQASESLLIVSTLHDLAQERQRIELELPLEHCHFFAEDGRSLELLP